MSDQNYLPQPSNQNIDNSSHNFPNNSEITNQNNNIKVSVLEVIINLYSLQIL